VVSTWPAVWAAADTGEVASGGSNAAAARGSWAGGVEGVGAAVGAGEAPSRTSGRRAASSGDVTWPKGGWSEYAAGGSERASCVKKQWARGAARRMQKAEEVGGEGGHQRPCPNDRWACGSPFLRPRPCRPHHFLEGGAKWTARKASTSARPQWASPSPSLPPTHPPAQKKFIARTLASGLRRQFALQPRVHEMKTTPQVLRECTMNEHTPKSNSLGRPPQ